MTRYVLADAAKSDLLGIWRYLDEHAGSEIAQSVVGDLRKAMRALARNPGIGHRREELTHAPVRFWRVGSYFVIYEPDTKPLAIVRVVHVSRDLALMLEPQ